VGSRPRPLLQDGEGRLRGRAALEQAKATGLKRILVGLEMIERGIGRDGYKIFDDAVRRSAKSQAGRLRRF